MGTKERLEILNEKYMAQEDFNDLLKNVKVKIIRYEEPIKLYSQQYFEEKDKTINELLKRISELEFEVERLNNIINELEKWAKEQKEYNDTEYPREFNDYEDVLNKIKELKGVDKE